MDVMTVGLFVNIAIALVVIVGVVSGLRWIVRQR
jgi:hypothetical protein